MLTHVFQKKNNSAELLYVLLKLIFVDDKYFNRNMTCKIDGSFIHKSL